jgi:hypothetical protein
VRHALLKLAVRQHQSRDAIAIDRVVSSTEALLARTQADFSSRSAPCSPRSASCGHSRSGARPFTLMP